jgi:hypothetical protein
MKSDSSSSLCSAIHCLAFTDRSTRGLSKFESCLRPPLTPRYGELDDPAGTLIQVGCQGGPYLFNESAYPTEAMPLIFGPRLEAPAIVPDGSPGPIDAVSRRSPGNTKRQEVDTESIGPVLRHGLKPGRAGGDEAGCRIIAGARVVR